MVIMVAPERATEAPGAPGRSEMAQDSTRAVPDAPEAVSEIERASSTPRCWLCRRLTPEVRDAVTAALKVGVPVAEISRVTGAGWSAIGLHREETIGPSGRKPAPISEPTEKQWASVRAVLSVERLYASLLACGVQLSLRSTSGLHVARAAGGAIPERIRTVIDRRALDLVHYLKQLRYETEQRRSAALAALVEAIERPKRESAERAKWAARWPEIRAALENAEGDLIEVITYAHRVALRADGPTVTGLCQQAGRIIERRWLPASLDAVKAGQEPWCTNEFGQIILVGRVPTST